MISLLEAQILRTHRKLLETRNLLLEASERVVQDAENSQNLETPEENNEVRTPQEPSKLQDTFNAVIAHGIYNPTAAIDTNVSGLMCYALLIAHRREVISTEQRQEASQEILRYLRALWPEAAPHTTLLEALSRAGLPNSTENRLAIYKDWENRPRGRSR